MTLFRDADTVIADLETFDRVVIRSASNDDLAALLTRIYEQKLVAVPLAPSVSDQDMRDIAQQTSAALVIDAVHARMTRLPAGERDPDADGLAYIMFTSGSTGLPKGVMLSRDAVKHNATAVAHLHWFAAHRPHATCLPFYHVNALMMSLHGTRLSGAALHTGNPRDLTAYFKLIEDNQVATASIVPALIPQLLDAKPAWPDTLEYLITAAAPLSSDLCERFYSLYGPRLRQGYGLSEAVNFSFTTPVLQDEDWKREYLRSHPPVGAPLPGTELAFHFSQPGRDGEVLVRSPALMRGYWKNPQATAEAIDSQGWLHTGDLGYLRDGLLVLTGRSKEVINRGGEKYYPLDVERQWRHAVPLDSVCAVPVKHDYLGHDIGMWAPGSDAHTLQRLHETAALKPLAVSTSPLLTTSTGKPQRLAMSARLAVAAENPDRYRELHAYAYDIAAKIVTGAAPRCAQAHRIRAAACALITYPKPDHVLMPHTAAHETLDLLAANWPRLADGHTSGEQLMRSRSGLWKELMTQWPMNVYPKLLAATAEAHLELAGDVLEVGTGVGNTADLLSGKITGSYTWTDKDPELIARGTWDGRGAVFDFDYPPPRVLFPDRFTAVIATNALHCAADPFHTLRIIKDLLRPGQRIYFAEGSPVTKTDGTPWCLDFLFCAFTGWWNRTGFLTRWQWLRLLEQAGYTEPGYSIIRSGQHDLGGVIWASNGGS